MVLRGFGRRPTAAPSVALSGSERAAELNAEATLARARGALTGLGGAVGQILEVKGAAAGYLDGAPWWYSVARGLPGLGLGMAIGEMINICFLHY